MKASIIDKLKETGHFYGVIEDIIAEYASPPFEITYNMRVINSVTNYMYLRLPFKVGCDHYYYIDWDDGSPEERFEYKWTGSSETPSVYVEHCYRSDLPGTPRCPGR